MRLHAAAGAAEEQRRKRVGRPIPVSVLSWPKGCYCVVFLPRVGRKLNVLAHLLKPGNGPSTGAVPPLVRCTSGEELQDACLVS